MLSYLLKHFYWNVGVVTLLSPTTFLGIPRHTSLVLLMFTASVVSIYFLVWRISAWPMSIMEGHCWKMMAYIILEDV